MTRVALYWLTNIVTPYRVPVWESLAVKTDFAVGVLATSEANRGWNPTSLAGSLEVDELRARSLSRLSREQTLYLPSRRLVNRLHERAPDAVVMDGWESPAFMAAALGGRRGGAAVVASYRSTLQSHRYKGGPVAVLRSAFFRQMDAVLTAGPASTEAVLAMGVPADRIVTGFNSVDVQAFADGAAQTRASTPPAAGHRFLYVGQLIERKNVGAALDAFAQIGQTDDTFTIVGTGPLQQALQQQADNLGLHDRVAFLGHREGTGLHQAYGHADTLVLPSSQEVWGLVVNEALAAGLHTVISADAGVVPSVQHMSGVHTAQPTPADLARAMSTSRSTWNGPVQQPEMLQHTPDKAADHILQAVDRARHRRDKRRS